MKNELKNNETGVNRHVYEKLDSYLSSENVYGALLIKGPWGVGKTFLIRDYIEKRTEYNFLYVSLNGVSKRSEIDDLIFESAHPKIAGIQKNKFFKLGVKILRGAASMARFNWSSTSQDGTRTIGGDVGAPLASTDEDPIRLLFNGLGDNPILVFDDLERCAMSIQDVFGYILQFIEQDQLRVIILGNEEEINEKQYEPLRMMDRLCEAVEKMGARKSDDDPAPYTKNANNSFPLYSRYREKTIYDETAVVFDVETACYFLCKCEIPDSICLPDILDVARSVLESRGCRNLRHCIFASKSASEFLKRIDDNGLLNDYSSEKKTEIVKILLRNFFNHALLYRNNQKSFQNTNEDLVPAIKNYLTYGSFPKRSVVRYLELLDKETRDGGTTNAFESFRNTPFSSYANDEKCQKSFHQFWDDFKAGKIGGSHLESVIDLAYQFFSIFPPESNDGPTIIREAVNLLLNEKYGASECPVSWHIMPSDEKRKELFNTIRDNIANHNRIIRSQKAKKIVNKAYQAPSLEVEKMILLANESKSFLAYFYSTDELISFLENASNSELDSFNYALVCIYQKRGHAPFAADKEMALAVIRYCEKVSKEISTGRIRAAYLSFIHDNLLGFESVPD